ncbi:MAG: glycosyl transferase [Bacteroidales bacterium]|nr:glycosyl transferase [Bacteroidales bacterium]
MNAKIKRALTDPYYACGLILNRIGRFISDERFVKWDYYFAFHKKLNLDNPQTYNEKLQWLKLYDQHEEYTLMVDKYEVKKYVASIIGEDYIIPTLGVYNSFDEIDFDKLPNQFVLKCTHDSGGVAICKDKSSFDFNKARKLLSRNIKRNPFWASREYPYKNVKPRILVEKFLEDKNKINEPIKDYKFYCFDGKPVCVLVCTDREVKVKYYYFSPEWHFLRWDKETGKAPDNFTLPKPQKLEEMLQVAATLSKGLLEVRIDLYEVNGNVYFGEYTFFSNSGLDTDITEECDKILGDYLIIRKE